MNKCIFGQEMCMCKHNKSEHAKILGCGSYCLYTDCSCSAFIYAETNVQKSWFRNIIDKIRKFND